MLAKNPPVADAGQALAERFAAFAAARNVAVTDDAYQQLNGALGVFLKAVAAELERLDSEIEHLKARA